MRYGRARVRAATVTRRRLWFVLLACFSQTACGDLLGLGTTPVVLDGGTPEAGLAPDASAPQDAGSMPASDTTCTFNDDASANVFDTCTFQ